MKKPNIVYILADDLGYGDLSCLNPDSKIPTRNMDRLAADGVTFTDAHSNSAVCTPTRYGVLTGRYCWRSRLKRGVLWGWSPPLIEEGRMTVASFLRAQGYRTACVGKWHLGLGWGLKDGGDISDGREFEPADVDFSRPLTAGPHTAGFDESFIIPASLDMDPYCYIENGRLVEQPTATTPDSGRPAFWRGGPCAPGFSHETCLLELTIRAESFIRQQADSDQPFFLYFPTPSPHTPHFARGPFKGSSNAGVYGDYVVEHDWSVGRIIDAIDRNGLAENTLVIVTSDNGAHCASSFSAEAAWNFERDFGHRSSHIYRGQKSDAWDGGHRIPFLARWTGTIQPGRTCQQTVCLTDLLATCAGLLDQELPREAGEDSANMLPLLLGESDEPVREATVHHSINGSFAIRQDEWKLVACPGSGGWSLPADRVPAEAPPMQLYNMARDPEEQHNLYPEMPEVADRLLKLLEKYRESDRSV